MATIYTIGHSTRTLDELIAALKKYEVRTLVDIRSFPMSRRLPHFNRESLELELPKHGIVYRWMKELGGRRKRIRDDSPNTGLRNDSFRNYADYMLTENFAEAVERLLEIADPALSARTADEGGTGTKAGALRQAQGMHLPAFDHRGDMTSLDRITNQEMEVGNTAIMCAERMYLQCHRMLVSDYLKAHGHTVLHIDDDKRPVRPHRLLAQARLLNNKLVYNSLPLFENDR